MSLPYFVKLSDAEVSSIIDEFERLSEHNE